MVTRKMTEKPIDMFELAKMIAPEIKMTSPHISVLGTAPDDFVILRRVLGDKRFEEIAPQLKQLKVRNDAELLMRLCNIHSGTIVYHSPQGDEVGRSVKGARMTGVFR